jgi:serine/threonine protein kinase
MAPELFTTFRVSAAVDIYAFGVLLFEALHAHEPWPETGDAEVVRKNTSHEKPAFDEHVSASIRMLITRCRKKPNRRPTAEELLVTQEGEFSSDQKYPDKATFAPERVVTLHKCALYTKKAQVARDSGGEKEPEITPLPLQLEASTSPRNWLPGKEVSITSPTRESGRIGTMRFSG